MNFVIGSTRAGLQLKRSIIEYMTKNGHMVEDVGMKDEENFVPYHIAAANVAKLISQGKYEKGIIICGTGAGSAIVANKFKGVYAVHCTNSFEAKKASAINNANVLVLAEWLTPANHAFEIISDWLSTPFGSGFDEDWKTFLSNCIDEIKDIEEINFK
ncbi:MAG: RpiB/LacA/LacB family sugar-phosphate isomerase [Spirochaetes bacterium]|nr:RpiB/LacA/LacB family sugar-phosphate isomerase [Spirochaetota bacterium]